MGDHGSWSFLRFEPKDHDPVIWIMKKSWPGSKIGRFFFDPDQKLADYFLIRIKKLTNFFWSGSKNSPFFLIRIKKRTIFFLIRIKKRPFFFWSGSKIGRIFFDPDQKLAIFFLIRIKKWADFFWSGSKIGRFFFDLDQKFADFFLIRIKNFAFAWIFFDPDQKSKIDVSFFYPDYECKTWLETLFFCYFIFLIRSENKLQVTIVLFFSIV